MVGVRSIGKSMQQSLAYANIISLALFNLQPYLFRLPIVVLKIGVNLHSMTEVIGDCRVNVRQFQRVVRPCNLLGRGAFLILADDENEEDPRLSYADCPGFVGA